MNFETVTSSLGSGHLNPNPKTASDVLSLSAELEPRNSEDCKCIIACQQYRARECVNCDTLLYASTAPVVEESK